VIVANLVEPTGLVVIINVAVVLPAATFTVAGTAANELLLDNPTEIPPAGAAPLKVTVPVDDVPPLTVVGFIETEIRLTVPPE
jgi:hypothetical protein